MKDIQSVLIEEIARTEACAHIRDIGGIPAAITDKHNECFYHWQMNGLENATLLHIDAHPDMFNAAAPFREKLDDSYYEELGTASFICATVHYGIVSSVYWLNPHSLKRRLQDMGSTKLEKDRRQLKTEPIGRRIRWASRADKLIMGEGKIITPENIEFEKYFILDIDLDAFCWQRNIIYYTRQYPDEVNNYEQRIDQTIEVLRRLRRPDIITITRSQEKDRADVPPDKVDAVQTYSIAQLRKLYERERVACAR